MLTRYFKDKYYNLVKKLLGEDVYSNQFEYPEETEMPKGSGENEWIGRI